jgi:hypothetical protein
LAAATDFASTAFNEAKKYAKKDKNPRVQKCRSVGGGRVLGMKIPEQKEVPVQMLAFLTLFPAARRHSPNHDPIQAQLTLMSTALAAAARLLLAFALIGVVVTGLQIAATGGEDIAVSRVASASSFQQQGTLP